MLNLMVLEGYIKDDPIEFGNDNFKGIKFTLASKRLHYDKNERFKYILIAVVVFGDERIDYVKNHCKKGDFVGCIGQYNIAPYSNKYYPQLVLKEINKNFATGDVPTKETVGVGDSVSKNDFDDDESEMNW